MWVKKLNLLTLGTLILIFMSLTSKCYAQSSFGFHNYEHEEKVECALSVYCENIKERVVHSGLIHQTTFKSNISIVHNIVQNEMYLFDLNKEKDVVYNYIRNGIIDKNKYSIPPCYENTSLKEKCDCKDVLEYDETFIESQMRNHTDSLVIEGFGDRKWHFHVSDPKRDQLKKYLRVGRKVGPTFYYAERGW